MKHQVSITTAEALVINKALRMDLGNEVDNALAKRLIEQINDKVTYDLQDYRCENCKKFDRNQGKNRAKGCCVARSGWGYKDMRYARSKACKSYFEKEEEVKDD